MKKLLSVLLSVVMTVSLCAGLDFSALANETPSNDGIIDSSPLVREDAEVSLESTGTEAPSGFELAEDNNDSTEDSASFANTVYFTGATLLASSDILVSGTCGSNLKWVLTQDGELIISGTGNMTEFSAFSSGPWFDFRRMITSINIESGVTSISQYAFLYCANAESVTIPSTVTKIGKAAFVGCTSLTSVVLPDSVTEISYALFGACSNLTSVISPSVTAIDSYAFQETGITSYEIGKNVTDISALAFYGTVIESFSVESGNTVFSEVDGVLYTNSGKTLFAYPAAKANTSFAVPSTVTEIGKAAFVKSENLQSVTIPNSVTTLGESAFQASGITSVTIPDSVTSAGMFTFYNSKLKTVTFGTGLESTTYEMFEKCQDLTTINFPSTPLELDARTFAYCISLKTVNLPSTVTAVGNGCFGECSALTTVVTNGVKDIPFQTFLNCKLLTSVTLNNVENIYRSAFYGCSSLMSVTLPATTQYVHNIAFPKDTQITCNNTDLGKFGYNGYRLLQDISITGSESYTEAYKVLDLVNSERAAAGLDPLVMDESLLSTAMQRAAEISVCFSHTRPDSSTVFEMNSKLYGENIAAGQSSAADVMTSWMNSDGHRGNILSPYCKIIGIGCFKIEGVYYWVQAFGIDQNTESFAKPADKSITENISVAVGEFEEGTISPDEVLFDTEKYNIDFAINIPTTSITTASTAQASVYVINPGFGVNVKINDTGFVWSSSNSKVATVNSNGLVTGIGAGTATINMKLGFVSADKTVTVKVGAHTHTYDSGKVTKAATTSTAGVKTYTCTGCGETKTEAIAKIASAALNTTATYYTGTVKTPTVTVKDSAGKTLVNGTDYTVTMDAGRINVGRYAVKITYKGNYSGTQTLYFNIIPKGTDVSGVTVRATGFTVQWNTQKTQTTGYQVQYSKNSNFTSATTINMPKPDYYAKAVSGLAKNTKYYVRVRTYTVTKFNGANYTIYSPWTAVKTVYTVTTTASLNTTATYYTGTVKTPTVTVKDSTGRVLKNGTDYTVTQASGRKNVGRYAVKITYKGTYEGVPAQTLYFNIIPRGITGITKVTASSKGFTVQWNTQKTATTGYQVQYSTSSNFANAKTITMPKNVYYAKKVTGLAGNKKYYVRVRTYTVTKFNGKNYNIYSPWCAVKTVTTK